MNTHCNGSQMEFQAVGRRKVQADFDGGHLSSDSGALLLREVDLRLGITERLGACFVDHRDQDRIEHTLPEMLRQRVFGIAQGYEDLNDHDDLACDVLLSMAVGKQDVTGQQRHRASDQGKALASSSTLNRLELSEEDAGADSRYKKIVYDPVAIEDLFVSFFLEYFDAPPEEIILDFDATDDPLHGSQEGAFYHGYYQCYCYMPLYVTCGDHLLASPLRTANQDASAGTVPLLEMLVKRIRACWGNTRIILRADSGFMRDPILSWCESHDVYYVIGLAKNSRLRERIRVQQHEALCAFKNSGHASRVFTEFRYRTRDSWSRARRVVAKAEHLAKGANPRFVVTNIPGSMVQSRELYEDMYCARGDMENRIKEQQMDLFADRTSAHTMRANQLRLWFSSVAYVLASALRRIALKGTRLAKATCGTIRVRLLKLGARIRISARRFLIELASACPYQDVFRMALQNIHAHPLRE